MKKICGLYTITSPKGKVYIGQSHNILSRWKGYKKLRCKSQTHLFRSLKKYGVDKHQFDIILECSETKLNYWEEKYINLFATIDKRHGLNCREGGKNSKMSITSCIRLSKAKKGCTLSTEHKEKIRLASIGRYVSPETRQKISNSHKGKTFSLESRQKMSISQKKNPNRSWLGKKLSSEHKLKLSLAAIEKYRKLKLLKINKINGVKQKRNTRKVSESLQDAMPPGGLLRFVSNDAQQEMVGEITDHGGL
jgi:group I intron endonuclease